MRNYRTAVVVRAVGEDVRDAVPAGGQRGNGVRQLLRIVARRVPHLRLNKGQARRYLQDLHDATGMAFVTQLQFLESYLEKMQAQDPDG